MHHTKLASAGLLRNVLRIAFILAPLSLLNAQLIEGRVQSEGIWPGGSTNWPAMDFRFCQIGDDWDLETRRGTNMTQRIVRKDNAIYTVTQDLKHSRSAAIAVRADQFDLDALGPLERLILLSFAPIYPQPGIPGALPAFLNPREAATWTLVSAGSPPSTTDAARTFQYTNSAPEQADAGPTREEGSVTLGSPTLVGSRRIPSNAESRRVTINPSGRSERIDRLEILRTTPDCPPVYLPSLTAGTSVEDVRSGSNYFYTAKVETWLDPEDARQGGRLLLPIKPSPVATMGMPLGRSLLLVVAVLPVLFLFRRRQPDGGVFHGGNQTNKQ